MNTLPVQLSNYAVPGKMLDKQIRAIKGMASVLDDKIHCTVVASYAHALPPVLGGHGDCSYLTKLLNAARHAKSLRVQQLTRYVTESGPFAVSESDTGEVVVRYKKKYQVSEFRAIEDLIKAPFYQAPERTTYAFELVDSLEKMIKTGNRQIKHIAEANALNSEWTKVLQDALKQIEKVKNYAISQQAKAA